MLRVGAAVSRWDDARTPRARIRCVNAACGTSWSAHYDTQVLYVGHAETWDMQQIDGSVEGRDCRVAFRSADRTLAVATIGRDLDSLRAELDLEVQGPLSDAPVEL